MASSSTLILVAQVSKKEGYHHTRPLNKKIALEASEVQGSNCCKTRSPPLSSLVKWFRYGWSNRAERSFAVSLSWSAIRCCINFNLRCEGVSPRDNETPHTTCHRNKTVEANNKPRNKASLRLFMVFIVLVLRSFLTSSQNCELFSILYFVCLFD